MLNPSCRNTPSLPGSLEASRVHRLAHEVGEDGCLVRTATGTGSELQSFFKLEASVVPEEGNGELAQVHNSVARLRLRAFDSDAPLLPVNILPAQLLELALGALLRDAKRATGPWGVASATARTSQLFRRRRERHELLGAWRLH